MKNSIKIKNIIKVILSHISLETTYSVMLTSLLLQFLFSFYQSYDLSRAFEVLFFIVLLYANILTYLLRKKEERRNQVVIIDIIIGGLWTFGTIRYGFSLTNVCYCVGMVCLIMIAILQSSIIWGASRNNTINRVNYKNLYYIIAVIFIILCMSCIDDVPILDSGCYYGKYITNVFLESFNYSSDLIINYCLAGHLSMGYSLFVLIGMLIFPNGTMGIYIMNIVLALWSGYCFYCILINKFKNNYLNCLLCTCLYMFSPYMLGLVGTINTDIASLYFIAIFYYYYVTDQKLLFYFGSLAFVFCKEPCVIVYALFIASVILCNIARRESIKQIVKVVSLPIMTICFWLVFFLSPYRGENWTVDKNQLFDSNSYGGIHCFGFNTNNCVTKLKQLFIFQYSWVIWLLILFFALYCVKKRNVENFDNIIHMLSMLIGIIIFNLMYIDYPHPRYIIMAYFCACCIFSFLILQENGLAYRIIIFLICIVTFIQTYINIDPVSSCVTKEMLLSDRIILSDGYIYNREYRQFETIIEKSLEQFEYEKTDAIVAFTYYSNITYGCQLYWNYEKKKLQSYMGDNTVPVEIANEEEEMWDRNVLYIDFPGGDPIKNRLESLKSIELETYSIRADVYYGFLKEN